MVFSERARLYFVVFYALYILSILFQIIIKCNIYFNIKLNFKLTGDWNVSAAQQNVDLSFNKESQILTYFSSAGVRIVHLKLRGVALCIMFIFFS